MTIPGNRRLATLVAALAVAVLAVAGAIVALGGSEDEPPPADAAKLVPDSALVFASVSTDGERDAVRRASRLAERFGSYDRARDALLMRLSGGTDEVDQGKDVAPWAGDEAAFALLDTGSATAGSLVLVAVTDEEKAKAFLERNPREAIRKVYKGHDTIRYGTVTTAFADGFLLIGQDPTVQSAIDRVESGAKALDGSPTYERAIEGLPEGRTVTAYASADGLRRLLAPQGSIVGGIAAVIDQPGLEGVALGAGVEGDDTLRVRVHSALEEGAKGRDQFEPELLGDVPEAVLGYLGASGISGALQRLVASTVGGTGGGELGELLARLRTELDKEAGGGLEDGLLKLFEGEVALVIQRQTPAPVFTLVTRTDDEQGTRRVLDRLRDPLARLLRPEGEPELEWKAEDIGGTDGWTLVLPSGQSITYAVAGGRLILSTSPDGVRGIVDADDKLEDSDIFEDVLSDRPDEVGTLGFLDFSQLLELAEQTGLNDSRQYLAVRDDLRKVRALGVSSSGGEGESTAEILVSIP